MDESSEVSTRRRPWAAYLSVLAIAVLVASSFAITARDNAAGSVPPTPVPSAVGPRHEMFLGTVALTIQTTNPLQYTLVDEYYIVGNVYSFLLNFGPNWELEPDLAVSWAQTSTNPTTYEFHLTPNAYFVDPRGCDIKDAQGHITDCQSTGSFAKTNVKASDVKFTLDYVKANANATSYFSSCVEGISHVDLSPTDPYFVRIVFQGSYAAAIAAITCVPILPQYIWAAQKVTWTNALPIGSGPMMVRPVGTTFAMVTPPPLILDRNPDWHGKEVQSRQVFSDTLFVESYTTSGAMSVDLALGKIDFAIGPNSQDYTGYLSQQPGILRQAVGDGFEAEQAINVLPDNLRASFAAHSTRPLQLGHTNPVLLNQIVRDAIHMVTNRTKMINNALNGLATPGDTLFPISHPLWLDMPAYSPDDKDGNGNPFDFPPFSPTALEQFPDGSSPASYGAPQMARNVLVQAGWAYVCATGQPQTGTEFPLCQKDSSGKMVQPLSFTYSTFNTEPWWQTAAQGVIDDAAKAGIQFTLQLLNPSQMYSLWYRLDYEVWLWDWVWTPVTDTSQFLIVQTCHGILTLDNDNGFCQVDANGHWSFDNIYNATLTTTDPAARKVLSDQAQDVVYGFASYNLPFYRDELYAYNQLHFTNFVDMSTYRAVPIDVGNTPIFAQTIFPVDDKPPQFTLPAFSGVVNSPVQFSVAAIDPQGGPLNYRWDFNANSEPGGTGVNNDGITWNDDQGGNIATPSFTYGAVGTYTVTLRVSQAGGDFFTVHRTTVTISSAGTGSPKINGFGFSPSDPTTYAGDAVTLAVSASDPAGLTLTQYTWNWADGSAATTTTLPTATHQYTTASTYTVQVTVRNSAGTTSTSSTIVPVVANVAPVLAPLQSQAVQVNTAATFAAFASDANSRDLLTYTWNFGDGSPTGSGNPVTHTYTTSNVQVTLQVTVSDGHGHSVSSSTTLNVVPDRNTAPSINTLTSSPSSTYTTQPVTLTAGVSDPQGNALLWQWDFNNDGIIDKTFTTPLTPPNTPVTDTETYLYTVAGTAKAKLTITDQPPSGQTPKTVFTTVTTSVAANSAPTLTALSTSPSSSIPGQDVTFSSTSNDVNGDKVSYTWNFGDGTTASGQTGFFGGTITGTHAYSADGTYEVVLNVNDGKGGTAGQATFATVSVAGLLRVTTNPALPGKILVDGVPADEWGLTWMKIAPGTHTVSFGGLNGLATPADQTVTVTSGATATAQGNYGVNGYLRVLTSPAVVSTISVNGVPRDDWGMWTAFAPGTYTVHFGLVAGYNPPPDQTAIVTAGATTTITGTFTSNPTAPGPDPTTFGYLRVTTNPATAAQILVNGVAADDWGLTWVKLAPGTYTVSFGQGYGYTPPAPKTVSVAAGATTTWDAPFVRHGSLRVTTDAPSAATVFVNGVPRDDWGMWQSMPPGTYKVSFGPVPGYVTPLPQTATVTVGVTTPITGHYIAAAIATPLGTATDSASPSTLSAAAPSISGAAMPSVNSVASSTPRATSEPYAADGRVAVRRLEST